MTDPAFSPRQAVNIAPHARFALKAWALQEPAAGAESLGKVKDLVLERDSP